MDLTVLESGRAVSERRPQAHGAAAIVDRGHLRLSGGGIASHHGNPRRPDRTAKIAADRIGVVSGSCHCVAAFPEAPGMLIARSRAARGRRRDDGAIDAVLISNMFRDDREKTFAVSVWVASFSLGGAIGPAIGGLILARFWWGAVFLAPIPVMALLLIAGPLLLPEHKNRKRRPARYSQRGPVRGCRAADHLWHQARRRRWQSGCGVVRRVVGLVFGAWFLRRQARLSDPLLDLALFTRPAVTAALAINFRLFCGLRHSRHRRAVSPVGAGADTAASGALEHPVGLGFVVGSLSDFARAEADAAGLCAWGAGLTLGASRPRRDGVMR